MFRLFTGIRRENRRKRIMLIMCLATNRRKDHSIKLIKYLLFNFELLPMYEKRKERGKGRREEEEREINNDTSFSKHAFRE